MVSRMLLTAKSVSRTGSLGNRLTNWLMSSDFVIVVGIRVLPKQEQHLLNTKYDLQNSAAARHTPDSRTITLDY